jgi:uncharacterized integral membrane protein (TIGR00697 family)
VKSYTYLPAISGLFTATLLISNVLNGKVLSVGPLSMTGGILLWPLGYLFSDLLTEVYGYAESRKVIWTGFASLTLLAVMIQICGALPADPSWPHQDAYTLILGRVPRIVAASIAAYFLGEFSNSYILARSKVRTRGALMFFRFVLSTVVGQLIDTVIFVGIAFSGVLPARMMLSVGLAGWLLKVIWEIAALPLTLPVVNALKRREQVDYFDVSTDFNPLRF